MDRPQEATTADIHGEWLKTLEARTVTLERQLVAVAFVVVAVVVAAVVFTQRKRQT